MAKTRTDLIADNNYSREQVRQLVYQYKDDPVITEELYAFGKMFLSEVESRVKQLEAKATSVLGWSVAILAFLFTQLTKGSSIVDTNVSLLSGTFAALAVERAYLAVRGRSDWLLPSDRDWFGETALGSGDELKRFHIRSIHEMKHNQNEIANRKSRHLLRGEKYLVLAAAIFVAGIGLHVLKTTFPLISVALSDRIRLCLSHL